MIMESAVPRRFRVAHLTSVHTPLDPRIVYKECVALSEAGYDVVVVAPGQASLPPGLRLHSVPLPANRLERMTRTIWQVFRAAREERADVYHFHDPELMGVGLALRALGARVVFDVHEDIPADIADKPWIAPPIRRPLSYAAALWLKILHRAYSGVVAATPAIARRFPNRHTVVVCNYPRIEEFATQRGENFELRSASALYIGSITELRCIDEMVSAFSSPEMDPRVRLMLAGTFEDEQLQARIQKMSGWKCVDYLGQRPRQEVARMLTHARCGLLLFRPAANHEDAMPTKLFEYMAAGLPVIISDSLRWSAVVREHDCGLVVNPFDRDALARAIVEIVLDPQRAQAMGERGRVLVNERYQWNSEAKKLQNLYATLV
jgi:glycosyltransferase involved in cell wall biosynthesis